MKLRCKEFGPIKDGTIDLDKDLIILCGRNNSGKTYLSYLIYGLLKGKYSFDDIEPFVNFEQLKVNDYYLDPHEKMAVLQIDLAAVVRTKRKEIEEAFGKIVKSRLLEIFPDTSVFAESSFELMIPDNIVFENREFYNSHVGTISSNFGSDSGVALVSFEKGHKSNIIHFQATHPTYLKDDYLTREIISIIHSIILNIIFINSHTYTLHETYFFPAERLALEVFNWDVIGSRPALNDDMNASHMFDYMMVSPAAQAHGTGGNRRNINDSDQFYPLPIRDFIIRSSSYAFYSNVKGDLFDLGEELEEAMGLHMGMQDAKTVSLTTINGTTIPIKLASSTVKSISSFIFYLKHESKLSHAIFFDEPELGLHPILQRKLAVILAKMVRKGIKLILSTHSDFMLLEFNNLIMLHQDTNEAKKLRIKYNNIGYGLQSTLDPERVGVNVLSDGTINSSYVSTTGFDVSVIDDVIESQNKIAEDIYFSLF